MGNEDKRKLSLETKYELRKQVVRLKRSGRQTSEIVEISGLRSQSVNRIWRLFLAGGYEAIKMRPLGRRVGEKRRLTLEQEMRMQRLMLDKTPEQLRLRFAMAG